MHLLTPLHTTPAPHAHGAPGVEFGSLHFQSSSILMSQSSSTLLQVASLVDGCALHVIVPPMHWVMPVPQLVEHGCGMKSSSIMLSQSSSRPLQISVTGFCSPRHSPNTP